RTRMSTDNRNSSTALGQGLSEAIRSAREQHRAGAGAVLDIMVRGVGVDTNALSHVLREQAGVEILHPTPSLVPDTSRWDVDTARKSRCVVLRGDTADIFVAAEDPWDELLMQRVARRIGTQPIAAAATRASIQSWLGESSAAGTTP